MKEYGLIEKGDDPKVKKGVRREETGEHVRLLVDLGELIRETAKALGFSCEDD